MLGEYKVGRCSRQCFKQERPLREGEAYFSVIVADGEDYQRRDYSAEAWEGPPADAIGHWRARMPKSDERKLVLAPKSVLVGLLREMENFPEKAKPRYLLALTMMRKRILRPAPVTAASKAKPESLFVQVIQDDSIIEVPVCEIDRAESDRLREELNELLYCDAAEIEDEMAEEQE